MYFFKHWSILDYTLSLQGFTELSMTGSRGSKRSKYSRRSRGSAINKRRKEL